MSGIGESAGQCLGDSISNSRGNERAIGLLARLERVTENARTV